MYMGNICPNCSISPAKEKSKRPSAAPPCSANCSVCDWQQEEEGQWETDCDETFEFQEGGPLDNGFEWCPYCGKKLVETIYSEPQNASDVPCADARPLNRD